jgi:hypothetical protein
MKDIVEKEFGDYIDLRKCYDKVFNLLKEKTLMISPGSIETTREGEVASAYRNYRAASFLVPLSNPAVIYMNSEELRLKSLNVSIEDKLVKNDEDKKTIEDICNLIKEIAK